MTQETELKHRKIKLKHMRNTYHRMTAMIKHPNYASNPSATKQFGMWRKHADYSIGIQMTKIEYLKLAIKN